MAISATSADANGPSGQASYQDERKSATILFADIVGSTSMIARQDPEAALDLLRPALGVLSDAAQRYGGTVNRVTGDGLMVMFGAPLTEEEHALGACCAALEMHAALARSGSGIQLRIGMHSGEIVMHQISMGLVHALDAAGEAVHLAARLQQDAPAGSIWISEATFALARGRLQTRIVGSLNFRGFETPTIVHLLQAADASLSRLDVAGRRGLSPFVNRHDEMAALEAAFQRAAEGRGCAVALIGDAGAGKSRIIREFVAARAGVRVLEARCTRWRDDSGFHPMRVLTGRLLGLDATEDASATHARFGMASAAPGAPSAEVLEAVAVLQGLGVPRGIDFSPVGRPYQLGLGSLSAWKELAPNARRRRIIEGCLTLLLQAASDKPLLVVLDDIHWTDPDTEEVVERLLGALDGSRLLLLLGWRSGYQTALARHPALVQVPLAPLSTANARDLARIVLGNRAADEAAVAALADRAGGNPFFIEEAAAMPDHGELPPSVRSLLGARLDRLQPEQKQLIEVLATVGEPASAQLLAMVLESGRTGSEAIAAELEQTGLVRIDGIGESARFACRHSLVQEVAYRGLLHARRRGLHARIASVMEQLAGERAAEEAEVLARHARLGEDWDAALRHARAAGARAVSHFANREAVRFFDEAIEALGHLPDGAETLSIGLDIRLALRDPLFRLGRMNVLRGHLDEAATLAEQSGDLTRLGQLHRVQSHHAWLAGDYKAAIDAAQRMTSLAEAQKDSALRLRAVFERSLAQLGQGDYAAAAAGMREVAEHTEDAELGGRFGLDAELAVIALGYRTRALADLGDMEEAERSADACAERASKLGLPFASIFADLAAGYLLLTRDAAPEAVKHLAAALALCERAEAELMRPVALSFLGAAEVAAGQLSSGVEHLEQAVAYSAGMGLLFQQPLRLALLSEALAAAGRHQEAERRAAEARALAAAQGEAISPLARHFAAL